MISESFLQVLQDLCMALQIFRRFALQLNWGTFLPTENAAHPRGPDLEHLQNFDFLNLSTFRLQEGRFPVYEQFVSKRIS